MTPSSPSLRSRNRSEQTRKDNISLHIKCMFTQGTSKLLGSLPYKGNADDHHPDHNPLDAHKVNFRKNKFLKVIKIFLALSLIAQ